MNKLSNTSKMLFLLNLVILISDTLGTSVKSTQSSTCTASTVDGAVYKPVQRCTGRHMQEAMRLGEGCEPRPTLMALPWPNGTQIDQMTPTHITVRQCDGFCNQIGHTCMPTETRLRQVPVMLSKCGINSGTCDKECATLEVTEHLKCACACPLSPQSCSAVQTFRPELCACQCNDKLARQTCLDSGRVWNDATCSCGCSLPDAAAEAACPIGEVFSTDKCACVTDGERIGANLIEHGTPEGNDNKNVMVKSDNENGDEASVTSAVPEFKDIVICGLLSMVLILLLIVFTQFIRSNRQQRRYRLEILKLRSAISRESADDNHGDHQLTDDNTSDKYSDTTSSSGEGGFTDPPQLLTKPTSGKFRSPNSSGNGSHSSDPDMNCSTPSSGFYSEVGGLHVTQDHNTTTCTANAGDEQSIPAGNDMQKTTFDQQLQNGGNGAAAGSGENAGALYDQLYQSAEQVRNKKHYQYDVLPCAQLPQNHQVPAPASSHSSFHPSATASTAVVESPYQQLRLTARPANQQYQTIVNNGGRMNSPAVRPKPTAHQINMAAMAQGNNSSGGPAMPLPTIPPGHPQSYQHGSCDAIYGQHAARLNSGVTKILAGNQSPAMSAISEPIYAMRMPRNCAPPSQMSSLEMTTNPRIVHKASEVPMLDAIKCDSMYSAAAKNTLNTNNGCSETDKLLQQSTN